MTRCCSLTWDKLCCVAPKCKSATRPSQKEFISSAGSSARLHLLTSAAISITAREYLWSKTTLRAAGFTEEEFKPETFADDVELIVWVKCEPKWVSLFLPPHQSGRRPLASPWLVAAVRPVTMATMDQIMDYLFSVLWNCSQGLEAQMCVCVWWQNEGLRRISWNMKFKMVDLGLIRLPEETELLQPGLKKSNWLLQSICSCLFPCQISFFYTDWT